MITEFIYLAVVLLILGFLIYASIYLILLSYSWFKGAPYVATEQTEINEVLKTAKLQNGQYFYDLGCGDGRIVRQAVKTYGVHGIGIDVNPILIMLANMRSFGMSHEEIYFQRQDIFNTDLTQADVVYMYLLPNVIKRLESKLHNELKDAATVISYAFKVPYLEAYLESTHKGPVFTTYIYKI